MKFYVYIADAKIDRSLAELSREEREYLAGELNVDVAFLERAGTRNSDPDELRFARVTALSRHLARSSQAAYLFDQRTLHWGRLRRVRGGELLRHETESPVAFADVDGALLMMGSASQLLAQPPGATVDVAKVRIEPEALALAQVAPELDAIDRRCLEHVFEDAPPTFEPAAPRAGSVAPWMMHLARARAESRQLPAQRLEFLAKPLATIDARGSQGRIVVAAPLYVAMVV